MEGHYSKPPRGPLKKFGVLCNRFCAVVVTVLYCTYYIAFAWLFMGFLYRVRITNNNRMCSILWWSTMRTLFYDVFACLIDWDMRSHWCGFFLCSNLAREKKSRDRIGKAAVLAATTSHFFSIPSTSNCTTHSPFTSLNGGFVWCLCMALISLVCVTFAPPKKNKTYWYN